MSSTSGGGNIQHDVFMFEAVGAEDINKKLEQIAAEFKRLSAEQDAAHKKEVQQLAKKIREQERRRNALQKVGDAEAELARKVTDGANALNRFSIFSREANGRTLQLRNGIFEFGNSIAIAGGQTGMLINQFTEMGARMIGGGGLGFAISSITALVTLGGLAWKKWGNAASGLTEELQKQLKNLEPAFKAYLLTLPKEKIEELLKLHKEAKAVWDDIATTGMTAAEKGLQEASAQMEEITRQITIAQEMALENKKTFTTAQGKQLSGSAMLLKSQQEMTQEETRQLLVQEKLTYLEEKKRQLLNAIAGFKQKIATEDRKTMEDLPSLAGIPRKRKPKKPKDDWKLGQFVQMGPDQEVEMRAYENWMAKLRAKELAAEEQFQRKKNALFDARIAAAAEAEERIFNWNQQLRELSLLNEEAYQERLTQITLSGSEARFVAQERMNNVVKKMGDDLHSFAADAFKSTVDNTFSVWEQRERDNTSFRQEMVNARAELNQAELDMANARTEADFQSASSAREAAQIRIDNMRAEKAARATMGQMILKQVLMDLGKGMIGQGVADLAEGMSRLYWSYGANPTGWALAGWGAGEIASGTALMAGSFKIPEGKTVTPKVASKLSDQKSDMGGTGSFSGRDIDEKGQGNITINIAGSLSNEETVVHIMRSMEELKKKGLS